LQTPDSRVRVRVIGHLYYYPYYGMNPLLECSDMAWDSKGITVLAATHSWTTPAFTGQDWLTRDVLFKTQSYTAAVYQFMATTLWHNAQNLDLFVPHMYNTHICVWFQDVDHKEAPVFSNPNLMLSTDRAYIRFQELLTLTTVQMPRSQPSLDANWHFRWRQSEDPINYGYGALRQITATKLWDQNSTQQCYSERTLTVNYATLIW